MSSNVRPEIASEFFCDTKSPNLQGDVQDIIIGFYVARSILLDQRVWLITRSVVGERRRLDITEAVVGVKRWKGSAVTLHRTLQVGFNPRIIRRTGRPLWERKINAVPEESIAVLARP